MVNILLEGADIAAPWLRAALNGYIAPDSSVAVVALSFRDGDARSLDEWEALYGRGQGRYYGSIVDGLAAYGISEDNIAFINYFGDTRESAVRKIGDADIVYLTGGLPDRMMDRIDELGLRTALMQHGGIIMGYSAGALVQLAEYHLSPDGDYAEFKYCRGLPYLDEFYLEVHYEGRQAQHNSIARVLAERGKPVYATARDAGAIIVDDGRIRLLGDVRVFEP